eukprot:scaffold402191_cov22-Prasinocladus_malaysianus.AAC.1
MALALRQAGRVILRCAVVALPENRKCSMFSRCMVMYYDDQIASYSTARPTHSLIRCLRVENCLDNLIFCGSLALTVCVM